MSAEEQKQENQFFVEKQFSDEQGGPLRFKNQDELAIWLENEVSFWQWLRKKKKIADKHMLAAITPYDSFIGELEALLNDYKTSNKIDSDRAGSLIEKFGNFFHSNSIKAKAVYEVANTFGSSAGIYALAYATGKIITVITPHTFQGIVNYILLLQGLGPGSAGMYATAFETSRKNAEKRFSDLESQVNSLYLALQAEKNKFSQEIDREKKVSDKFFNVLRRWGRSRWKAYKAKNERDVNAFLERMTGIENLYRERLKLEAPVQYWQEKAGEHWKKSKSMRDTIISTVYLSSIVYSYFFINHWEYIVDVKSNSYMPAALLAFTTTILLWAGRIFVRLYLSERHLFIDASERAVMAQTYLTLVGENKLDPEDRKLVLAPLFRPSSDGIIKDDGAPSLGLASILSGRLAK